MKLFVDVDKDGIMVADYWTTLPPKADFENKIQTIFSETRERMAQRNLLSLNEIYVTDGDKKRIIVQCAMALVLGYVKLKNTIKE